MSLLLDAVTVLAVLLGMLFFLASTVGLLRFPDSLTRLHALTKADNLGLGFVVIGLLAQTSSVLAGAKLLLIWGLVMWASAAVSQLIARSVREDAEP